MKMNESQILVAYFSRSGSNYAGGRIVDLKTGNTERAARVIEALSGARLFKIEAIQEYPLDYTETTEVARTELRKQARPALKHGLETLEGVSTIILAYPNWWGTMPMPVFSFLESLDFTGKAIMPLCTHEGSALGHSEADIRNACPGAKVLKGLAIVGGDVGDSKATILSWLSAAGII